MKCANCQKEIIMLPGGGPWVHVNGFAIECQASTEAEPEEEPES